MLLNIQSRNIRNELKTSGRNDQAPAVRARSVDQLGEDFEGMIIQWRMKGCSPSLGLAAIILIVFQYDTRGDSSPTVTRMTYDVFTNPNQNKTNGERCRVYERGLVGGYCHNSNCTLCQCSSDSPTYIVHLSRCVRDSVTLSNAGTFVYSSKPNFID